MSWTIVSPSKKNDGRQQALIYRSLVKADPLTVENRNQNVDGSVTPVRFKVAPPSDQVWQLTRLIFAIRDSGSMDSGGWGDRSSPLVNGVTAGIFSNGQEIDFTPIPWTSHFDLAAVSYDVAHENFGQGDEYVVMRLTFSKSGQNFRLDGSRGDFLWIDVNDDLTYLVEQRAMVQGFIEGVYL